MAEQVQAILDQMVAPLRDLMDRGIFSESEIRAIVAKRRESEYLLRRRAARKADFLRYIEAEMSLEKLRAIRTRRVLLRAKNAKQQQQQGDDTNKNNNNNPKKKQSPIGDAHIVQHVHFLFTRAIRKFQSDVSLHLQHAEFAKQAKSYTRLGRIYAEALQVHPRNVGLWIEAASHEFFGHMDDESKGGERVGGGSVQNARILLQRGLRINPTSQDLWLQYFALEFHNIQKMRGRREILQLRDGGNNNEQDEQLQQDDQEDSSSSDPLFRDAPIPTVVYENAIKAIPDDVTFRLKFVDICGHFPQTESVESLVIDSIERDFNDKPEAWIARAAYAAEQKRKQGAADAEEEGIAAGFTTGPSTNNDEENANDDLQPRKKQKQDGTDSANNTHDEVISVLEEATNQISTCEMYLQSIQFARAYMQQLAENGDAVVEGENEGILQTIEETKEFVESLLNKASGMGLISSGLVMEHADYLAERGNTKGAVKVVEQFLMDKTQCTADTLVWMFWARLAEQLDPPRPAEDIYRMALNRIPMHDKGHRIILMELFDVLLKPSSLPKTDAEQQRRNDELSELFQRVLLLSSGDEYKVTPEVEVGVLAEKSVAVVCLKYLQYSLQVGGVPAARTVYMALLQSNYMNSSSGKTQHDVDAIKEFFDECIQLESSKKARKLKGKKQKNLLRLYDAAASFFRDADPDLADTYQQRRMEDVAFS